MTIYYRLLNEGETIQEGDEYFHCIGGGYYNRTWEADPAIGMKIDDSFSPYRRPIKGQIIDLPEIPGYEYTGEYRAPKPLEWFEVGGIAKRQSSSADCAEFPILRKIEPKQKYRPFNDYEEMKPHRDRWVTCIDGLGAVPLWHITAFQFITLLEQYKFEDTGEPVGVKE